MTAHYTDVERLLLERWTDVRGLIEAYDGLQESIEEVLTEVGEKLEAWAEERGYESDCDTRGAEFYIWKAGWANRRNDAGVYFTVGGVVPEGYRKCDNPHPYLWINTDLDNLRIKVATQPEFVRELKRNVGDSAREWEDSDCDDEGPLGRYLTAVTQQERISSLSSPAKLFEFVTAGFERLLPFADAVDQTVAKQR